MPELVANGPIIPVRLMNEQDSSRVIFFCGAGISSGPNSELPTFVELVEYVYENHYIDPDSVERKSLRSLNLDKVFGLLERPKRLGSESLRSTVIDRLSQPPDGPLEIHKALINLSRCQQGVRLVTTNFDNRFREAGLKEILIDTSPKLPVPKPHRWSSLVHLHGRINQMDGGPNLVLTSADFGRAYLTERWAARFITELFREFTVVFVGYSVSDPPMGYIVDALAAERSMGAQFTTAYAFANHDGTAEDKLNVHDEWQAKNIEPILYDNQESHRLLGDTLIEWARIQSEPYRTRSQIVLSGITKLPAGPNDPLVERVTWALQDSVAAKELADADPITDKDDFKKVEVWLDMFDSAGLLNCSFSNANSESENQSSTLVQLVDNSFQFQNPNSLDSVRVHLARWMARHLHVPQLLTWVLRKGSLLHPGLRRQIQLSLADPNLYIPSELRQFWTILLDFEPRPWKDILTNNHYQAANSEVERCSIENKAIESIVPRLVVCSGPSTQLNFRQFTYKNPRPLNPLDACAHLKLVVGNEDIWHLVENLSENATFLSRHAYTLTDYLERALTLMTYTDDYDALSYVYRPSIGDHEQNWGSDDWLRLINLTRDSYFALATKNREHGDNLLNRWILNKHPIFRRLALHALTENASINIHLARKLLIKGRWPGLWNFDLRREVLRFFRLAGSRLPRSLRVEIVRAIHTGPKANSKYPPSGYLVQEQAIRLHKLQVSGAKLDKKSKVLAGKHKSAGQDSDEERDEFLSYQPGPKWVGQEEFAPKSLVDGPVEDIVTVLKNKTIEEEEFQGLVRLKPVKAIIALKRLGQEEDWPTRFWKRFFWSVPKFSKRLIHKTRIQKYVTQVLASAPENLLKEISSAIAGFVEELAKDYSTENESELEPIWTLSWHGISTYQPAEDTHDDSPINDAISHAAGKLAEAALTRLWKYEPKPDEGFPTSVQRYFDVIATDPNGHLGRVMLVTRLYSLFGINREWVKEHLIPLLNPDDSEEAGNLWAAYAWSPTIGPDLLLAFKESFLQVLQNREVSIYKKNNLTELFMTICLEAPHELTNDEIRSIVGSMSQEELKTALFSLVYRLKGDSKAQGLAWQNIVHPWLQDHWPREAVNNTAGTSEVMLQTLVKCGDAFPEAVNWSLQYLIPTAGRGLYELRESRFAVQHPNLTLQVLDKVVDANGIPAHHRDKLREILDDIKEACPDLEADDRFRRLYQIATQ